MGRALVVDASAVIDATMFRGLHGSLHDAQLHAPSIVDYEVLSNARRYARHGVAQRGIAEAGLSAFAQLEIERHPAQPLARQIWALRDNFSAYDAAYVALAISLGIPLITLDLRLAKAADRHCEVLTE